MIQERGIFIITTLAFFLQIDIESSTNIDATVLGRGHSDQYYIECTYVLAKVI